MLVRIRVFWDTSAYRYTVTDVSEKPAPSVFKI